MIYWIYKDKDGLWRLYLKSANDEKIAESGESYCNKIECKHAIDLVKGSADPQLTS
ncbi:MAG: YegP family protein [Pyrinomonadaceae bacterium]